MVRGLGIMIDGDWQVKIRLRQPLQSKKLRALFLEQQYRPNSGKQNWICEHHALAYKTSVDLQVQSKIETNVNAENESSCEQNVDPVLSENKPKDSERSVRIRKAQTLSKP